MNVLCEHARSSNAQLRLNAMWALRNFVYEMKPEIKEKCLNELGHSWLLKLMQDGLPRTESDSSELRLGAPSKRKHSNSDDMMATDVAMDDIDDVKEDTEMSDETEVLNSLKLSSPDRDGSNGTHLSANRRIAMMLEAEAGKILRAMLRVHQKHHLR
jgi:hypothetical protein